MSPRIAFLLLTLFLSLCSLVVCGNDTILDYDYTELIDEVRESPQDPPPTNTRLFLEILQQKCGTIINAQTFSDMGHLTVLMLGAFTHPTTLMVSMERRVDAFFYRLIHDWCISPDDDVTQLLSHSTVLFMLPTKEKEKHNCDEYNNVATEEKNIVQLQKIFKFDFVMMFGTGGVKLRYLQQRNGMSEILMRRYQTFHSGMQYFDTDFCAGYNYLSRHGTNGLLIKELKWSRKVRANSDVFVRQMNGLLVLISCCYEEIDVDFSYRENRKSIIETMKLRSTGIHLTSEQPCTIMNDRGYPALRIRPNSTTFVMLPEGDVTVKIFNNSQEPLTSFTLHLNDTHRFEYRKILT